MKFILLAIAINPPTYMGTYNSQKSCEDAIRTIYATEFVVPNLQHSQQHMAVVNQIIETELLLKQKYRCVAK